MYRDTRLALFSKPKRLGYRKRNCFNSRPNRRVKLQFPYTFHGRGLGDRIGKPEPEKARKGASPIRNTVETSLETLEIGSSIFHLSTFKRIGCFDRRILEGRDWYKISIFPPTSVCRTHGMTKSSIFRPRNPPDLGDLFRKLTQSCCKINF